MGVELLDHVLCISFVGAEEVESEGAARYETVKEALRVCGGRRYV